MYVARRVQDEVGVPWRIWIPPFPVPQRCEAEHHMLFWQVRGTADLVVGDESYELTAGHAIWVPVATQHQLTVHGNSVTMPMPFEAARTATTLRGPTFVTVDRDLRTLMLAWVTMGYTIIQPQADIGRQILSMLEESPALPTALPMPTSEPALIIAETLRFNPGDTRGVEELAGSVHTSARSIERAFRAETTMTLRQWRIRNRVESAAILLRAHAGIDAVAHRVGYTNVNSFRRVFQGHFGISPSEYVERYRAQ